MSTEQIPRMRISEAEAAQYIGMSRPYLRLSRCYGTRGRGKPGPPFIRIGRAIRYDIRDLDAWLAKAFNYAISLPPKAPKAKKVRP